MTHVWMNLLAVLLTAWMPKPDASNLDWKSVDAEPNGGFVVIDRLENDVAVLETDNGPVMLPRTALPYGTDREGLVLEWRIATQEIDERLARAHERLERMQTESSLVIDL